MEFNRESTFAKKHLSGSRKIIKRLTRKSQTLKVKYTTWMRPAGVMLGLSTLQNILFHLSSLSSRTAFAVTSAELDVFFCKSFRSQNVLDIRTCGCTIGSSASDPSHSALEKSNVRWRPKSNDLALFLRWPSEWSDSSAERFIIVTFRRAYMGTDDDEE